MDVSTGESSTSKHVEKIVPPPHLREDMLSDSAERGRIKDKKRKNWKKILPDRARLRARERERKKMGGGGEVETGR